MQINPGNLHAPCKDLTLWPLHVTSPVTPARGPGPVQLAELSRLNTSSRFCQKHNFFRASKIRSVSTWRITWLLLFTLSIPLNQPSLFTRLTVLHVTPISISSTIAVPLIPLLPKFYSRSTKWRTPKSRNQKSPMNQKHQLLNVWKMLIPLKKPRRKRRLIATSNATIRRQSMASNRNGQP